MMKESPKRDFWNMLLVEVGLRKCSRCGYVPSGYGFCNAHHVNPYTKEFEIANFRRCKPSPERVQQFRDEMKKCISLCRRCHKIEHESMNELVFGQGFGEAGRIDRELDDTVKAIAGREIKRRW
jgi:hypothetical protein